jgi:hypothetical protein
MPVALVRRNRGEMATYVVEQVRSLGLDVESSRIMELYQTCQKSTAYEDPDFPVALESLKDMQQLAFVFDQMNAHREKPVFVRQIKHLLNDSVLPQMDKENSRGRDAQFELYLGAVCQNAGLSPEFAEPDITCVVEGKTFGIAAKRLKGVSSVEKHVRKAAKQIKDAKAPGIVALELSIAWNPTNTPIISNLQSQMYVMLAQGQANAFFDKFAGRIQGWVVGAGVLGVVVHDSRFRLRPARDWEVSGMWTWLKTTTDEKGREQDYESFSKAFVKGIPNITDLGV